MATLIMTAIAAMISGYLPGCFNGAVYFLRWAKGVDARAEFSGTAGATNAGRIGGRKFFAAVLFTDALKGAIAAIIGTAVGSALATAIDDKNFFGMCALFGAVCGHIFPAQLNFRGGKGLATTWGGMWIISPIVPAIMIIFAIAAKFGERKFCRQRNRRKIAGHLIIAAYPIVAAFFVPLDLWLMIVSVAVLLWSRQPRLLTKSRQS